MSNNNIYRKRMCMAGGVEMSDLALFVNRSNLNESPRECVKKSVKSQPSGRGNSSSRKTVERCF